VKSPNANDSLEAIFRNMAFMNNFAQNNYLQISSPLFFTS